MRDYGSESLGAPALRGIPEVERMGVGFRGLKRRLSTKLEGYSEVALMEQYRRNHRLLNMLRKSWNMW